MDWGAAERLPDEVAAPNSAGGEAGIVQPSLSIPQRARACLAHWFRPSVEKRSPIQLEAERYVLWLPASGTYQRWMAVAPCVAIQGCCGSIYSWSIFNTAMDTMVWRVPGANASAFLVSVASYGLCTFLLGAHIGRLGPFSAVARAAVLLPAAWALAAAASASGSLAGLVVGYGLPLGTAIAHAYLSTTSVMQRWFPDRKGLAAGAAVAGFGIGAFGWTMLGKGLLQSGATVPAVQGIFAGVAATAMLMSLPFMRLPPPGWLPPVAIPVADAGSAVKAADAKAADAAKPAPPQPLPSAAPPANVTAACRAPDRVYTFPEAASTLEFWLLAVLVFGSSMPGVVFLSSSADMAHYAFGLSSADAFSVTAAQNAVNFLGRLAWGYTSDRIGRKSFYLLAALGQALAVAVMPAAVRGGSLGLWLVAFLSIGSFYGGTFGVLPALTSELFGPGVSSATHGAMISFWALSAVVGVPIFTHVVATHTAPAIGGAPGQPLPDAYAVNAEWLLALPLLAVAAAASLNTRTRDRVLRRECKQFLRLRLPAGRVLVVDSDAASTKGNIMSFFCPRFTVLNAEQQAEEWAVHLTAESRANDATGSAGAAEVATISPLYAAQVSQAPTS